MQKRTIKSFVLRKGRMSPRQEQGLSLHLAQYILPLTSTPWDFNEFFKMPNHDVIAEIGFGMGHSLLSMAKTSPQLNFIGIEVHQAGIGSLAADLFDNQIENVRIAPMDAYIIFSSLIPAASLAGIQIFFPDPWPKKRHHKRRLIQSEFVQLLIKALRPGGFIHVATDWEEYAEYALSVLSHEAALENQSSTLSYVDRPATRPLTKFELRGQNLGHNVFDLFFTKK